MSGKSRRSRRASRAKSSGAKASPRTSPPPQVPPEEPSLAGGGSEEVRTRENTDELFARTSGQLVRFGREKRRGKQRRTRVLLVALFGAVALVVGLLVCLSRGLPR